MRFLLLVSVFLLSSATVKSQYQYDCRRMEDCKNGGTCTELDCTCTGTFGGYNCGYDTALEAACTAEVGFCQNDGVCYNDGTADKCACLYGFVGKRCENKTVIIDCEGDSVDFKMTFPTDFAGTVKLLSDSPECVMKEEVNTELSTRSYSVMVDISGNEVGCNMTNIEIITDPETGATEYSGLFQVNYVPMMTTSLDELYNLTCSHESADIKLSQSLTNVDVVNENLTQSDFNETYSPVELAVLDDQGVPLAADTQLFVGDVFQLHVYLTDELAFNDVLIERCTTNNTLENTNQKIFVVLDRGCPTKLSKRLTPGQVVKMYETTASDGTPVQTNGKVLSIEAFKFVDSSNIGVVCSAKVCKPGDTSCQIPTNCDEIMNQDPNAQPVVNAPDETPTVAAPVETPVEQPPVETPVEQPPVETPVEQPPAETPPAETPVDNPTDTPVIRRKRRATGNDKIVEEEAIVSTVLRVVGPNDYRQGRLTASETVNSLEKCLVHEEVTAVVAVLGTAVFGLLIACFILSCITLKRRARSTDYKTMPLPTTKHEDFRIPRAHINDSFNLGDI